MVNAFARDFPEELIREILSCVLYCDRRSFDSFAFVTYGAYPRWQLGKNASTLRVCKQWYRIGMPLLYEAVYIKNMAQLKALVTMLQERPEIGLKIRRLSLKDAFGGDLPTALSLTPNIHTLSVCAEISSKTSIAGLRALLKTSVVNVAPTRLMIEEPFNWVRTNAAKESMGKCLAAWVSKWPAVRRIDIGSSGTENDWCFQLLQEAKGLEYVGIEPHDAERLFLYRPDIATDIIAKPGFKCILLRGALQDSIERLHYICPASVPATVISERSSPDSDFLTTT